MKMIPTRSRSSTKYTNNEIDSINNEYAAKFLDLQNTNNQLNSMNEQLELEISELKTKIVNDYGGLLDENYDQKLHIK